MSGVRQGYLILLHVVIQFSQYHLLKRVVNWFLRYTDIAGKLALFSLLGGLSTVYLKCPHDMESKVNKQWERKRDWGGWAGRNRGRKRENEWTRQMRKIMSQEEAVSFLSPEFRSHSITSVTFYSSKMSHWNESFTRRGIRLYLFYREWKNWGMYFHLFWGGNTCGISQARDQTRSTRVSTPDP